MLGPALSDPGVGVHNSVPKIHGPLWDSETSPDLGSPPGTPSLVGKQPSPQTNIKGQGTGNDQGNPGLCVLCLRRAKHAGHRETASQDTSELGAEAKVKGTELSSHRDHLRIKQQHTAEDPVGRTTLQARFGLSPHPLYEDCCGKGREGQWEPRRGRRGTREGLPEEGTRQSEPGTKDRGEERMRPAQDPEAKGRIKNDTILLQQAQVCLEQRILWASGQGPGLAGGGRSWVYLPLEKAPKDMFPAQLLPSHTPQSLSFQATGTRTF